MCFSLSTNFHGQSTSNATPNQQEYNSSMINDAWEVVPGLVDRLVVGSRWTYKIKYAADDSVEKYKSRFVAKGMHRRKA